MDKRDGELDRSEIADSKDIPFGGHAPANDPTKECHYSLAAVNSGGKRERNKRRRDGPEQKEQADYHSKSRWRRSAPARHCCRNAPKDPAHHIGQREKLQNGSHNRVIAVRKSV